MTITSGRFSQRPHLWLEKHERLECPRGHHLHHNAALIEDECFICTHIAARGGSQCGERIYVLSLPGGRRYLAHVTAAEFLQIRDAQMDVHEILRFLGEPLPTATQHRAQLA